MTAQTLTHRMPLEYQRVVPEKLDEFLAQGWQVAGASRYADGQVSWLVWRPAPREEGQTS